SVEKGEGGKVTISEAEYTSEGFETDGLDPRKLYPAPIASHFTGKDGAYQTYPRMHYSGSHFLPVYYDDHNMDKPYHPDINVNPVINNTDGSIVGYKYFNFDKLNGAGKVELALDLIPRGVDGTITVYTEAPWKGNPSPVGKFEIKSDDPIKPMKMKADVSAVSLLKGKHPVYLVFSTPAAGSLCTLERIQFITE
ncbi:MAG: glycosyl hydrolase family 43, partial [Muribaculaceae bacterium]|nr:glycosyl hydrolase family 43 [Muribaculaceae bacterium]